MSSSKESSGPHQAQEAADKLTDGETKDAQVADGTQDISMAAAVPGEHISIHDDASDAGCSEDFLSTLGPYGTVTGLTDEDAARLNHMTDQHNALADTVHGMREQVGNMVLSQQALQAHVDRLDTGLTSVVEAQHANTAATQGLGAQIQQLLGHFSQMGPSSPPGLGSPTGPSPPQAASELPAPPGARSEAEAAAAAEVGGDTPSPVKAAGKGKTGAGAGAYSPH